MSEKINELKAREEELKEILKYRFNNKLDYSDVTEELAKLRAKINYELRKVQRFKESCEFNF
ncbi:MAG: hypothetical protein ACTSPP_12130 [Candidatus Heimdallarchaeaceae archaeon]